MIPEAQTYILDRVEEDDNGCWLWTQSLNGAGYGNAKWEGQRIGAHVLAYKAFVGPVRKGIQLDHAKGCPKHCANPYTLTPVDRDMNMRLIWRRKRGQMGRRDLRVARFLHKQVV
jgi:hypothetical protein